MAAQLTSVAADLINKGILKETGHAIALSDSQLAVLEAIAQALRTSQNKQFFVAVPESARIILRLIVADLLYLAVGRSFDHIYFVTDATGKVFLERTLCNLHTYSSDLGTVLLRYQSRKIRIIVGQPARSLQERDLVVLFRVFESAESFSAAGRKIIIFTLRDSYNFPSSFEVNLALLRDLGWAELSFNVPNDIHIEEVQDEVEILTNYEIGGLLQELNEAQVADPSLQEHVRAFSCFYSAVPVPLIYYSGFPSNTTADNKAQTMVELPSVYLETLSVRFSHYVALKSVCFEIEKRLHSRNPKYSRLLEIVRDNQATGRRVAICAPNKPMADALDWGIARDLAKSVENPQRPCIFYPEKVFAEALFYGIIFDEIIFPFSPCIELVLAACALTKKLKFIQYPHEATILEEELGKIQGSLPGGFPNFAHLCTAKVNRHPDEKSKGQIGTYDDFKIAANDYSKFLKYLSDSDPKDQFYTYEGFADTQEYVFHTKGGAAYSVHGWENVILCREMELFQHTKYAWVFPRDLSVGDSVILPPLKLKEDFLRKQISGLLAERGQQLEVLLSLVAKWKEALFKVSSSHEFLQIFERLREKGITKDYTTVKHWFTGLIDDPKQAALFSIMNAGVNIGPRDELDIKLVGEAFGIKLLSRKHKQIEAAMRIFRANNSSCGRQARANLIGEIEEPNIGSKCSRFKISRITVTGIENSVSK
jgi:hypothetical protein